jgi:hypothetical protein
MLARRIGGVFECSRSSAASQSRFRGPHDYQFTMVAHIENVHGDAACADCKGFRKIPMQRGNNTSEDRLAT